MVEPVFVGIPADGRDLKHNFNVGDIVETTEQYTDIMTCCNNRSKYTTHPLSHTGQIKEIIKYPTGSHHVILEGWDIPIGVRYIRRVNP